MDRDLEPEYARFIRHALLESRELLDEEKTVIEDMDGEEYGKGVVFDYDEFLETVGSEEGHRWPEQDKLEHIAVAETEEELVETVNRYLNENRAVVTSQELSYPAGSGSRY